MSEEEEQPKSRVLHTRVPEVLEKELKRLAKSLRVPVSNVVRTILEDAIDTMDAVGKSASSELRSVADRLRTEEDPKPPPAPRFPLEGAIGAARLRLMRDETCSLSGRPLPKGEWALLVHFDDGRKPLLVAPDLMPAGLGVEEPAADDAEPETDTDE